jgi:hypothetical protein
MKKTKHFTEKLYYMIGFGREVIKNQEDKVVYVNGIVHLMDDDVREDFISLNKIFFNETLALVTDLDPMQLPHSATEYWFEAADILYNLKNCSSNNELTDLFKSVFGWWFTENCLDGFEVDAITSEKLLNLKLRMVNLN